MKRSYPKCIPLPAILVYHLSTLARSDRYEFLLSSVCGRDLSMMRKLCFVSAVSAIALAAACSKHSGTPTSPSSTAVARPGASADTNNLKVSPPTPVAPANGAKLNSGEPVVLVVNNSSALYASGVALQYEFSVQDAGREFENYKVPAGSGSTRVTVDDSRFEAEKHYQWRARAILGDT